MGDLQEYRIQTFMKINTCVFTPREADLFSPLMCLHSCVPIALVSGVLQVFKT